MKGVYCNNVNIIFLTFTITHISKKNPGVLPLSKFWQELNCKNDFYNEKLNTRWPMRGLCVIL